MRTAWASSASSVGALGGTRTLSRLLSHMGKGPRLVVSSLSGSRRRQAPGSAPPWPRVAHKELGATLLHALMADLCNGSVLDDHPVVGRSAFDAVAEGEQTQGEQNWPEYASGYGGPSSRHGEWLACAAETINDLQSGSGTLPGPPLTGWWKPGLGRTKCGVDPAGMLWGACDRTRQVLGEVC